MAFEPEPTAASPGTSLESDQALAVLAATVRHRAALKDAMTVVALDAVSALPGADGAGVTLSVAGAVVMTAGSAPFVVDVDAVQYGLGEGPCVSAVAERRVLSTGSLGVLETRWPRFGADALGFGVRSVASFPLIVDDDVIGSINAYAFGENAFDPEALRRGEDFAGSAAVIVQRAGLVATTRLLDGELRQVMTDRATIENAVGVLMFRGGIPADEAAQHLRRIADLQDLELVTVARVLIADVLFWTRAGNPPA